MHAYTSEQACIKVNQDFMVCLVLSIDGWEKPANERPGLLKSLCGSSAFPRWTGRPGAAISALLTRIQVSLLL